MKSMVSGRNARWRFHAAFVIAVATSQSSSASAWRQCSGSGVCPDNNTCCPTSRENSSCITGKATPGNDMPGSCCSDDGTGLTGCAPGYVCSSSLDPSNYTKMFFCQLLEDENQSVKEPPEPRRLPRYQLCSVPKDALEQVHGLPIREPSRIRLSASRSHQLAYYSTMHSLDATDKETLAQHARVRVALIMVHGSGRNADDYLCCATSSIPKKMDASSVLVLAPRFLAVKDGPVNITSSSQAQVLRWNDTDPIAHTWRYGADAINSRISSYDAMDSLLEHLLFDKSRFPRLERVVVAGHSAGGQFTQRWALTSCSPSWGDTHNENLPQSVAIRIVVANPRSFCYLDSRRYVNESLIIPDESKVAACPGYNEWEWGLDSGGRLPTPYKDRALAKVGGRQQMVERYRSRDVVYLAGALDLEHVHSSCEDDDFQGKTRLERSQRFFASLKEIYGHYVHQRLVVHGVPHDHCLMFQSPSGQSAMFGSPVASTQELVHVV